MAALAAGALAHAAAEDEAHGDQQRRGGQTSSASTGSIASSTIVIPSASSADCTISPSVSENSLPIALTSSVTRVSRSPFWLRWWNASESRCRWS